MLIVVFCVLYFRYLDAKAEGRLDDGIDPPWMNRTRAEHPKRVAAAQAVTARHARPDAA